MTKTHDILVLGAGPAGSALASHLAMRGFDVAIADKKAFPRSKPCGEFLSPECRPYLRELGVDDALLQKGTRKVHGMQLCTGDRRARGRFRGLSSAPYNDAGYAVRREVLDLELLRAATARPEVSFLERHEFKSLLRDESGGIRGAVLRDPDGTDREVLARTTIGADGVHSRVARDLGVQRQIRWLDRLALVARFDGVLPAAEAEVHFVDNAYFAATTVDDGSFHLNLLVDRSTLAGRSGNVDAFVAKHLEQAPMLKQRLVTATRRGPWKGIGPLAFRTTKQTFRGAALVGDACGYVDPLTGEGIYFALHGARSLATALEVARQDPARAAAAMHGYEQERRAEVLPRLRLAALLQRGIRHPFLVRSCLSALSAWPRLCDLLVNMTGDAMHPRDLLSPAFWRQWRQAGATT
ncbi:MAG: FAD-dependent monooxygenase [Planctomycetota bacterium]